MKVMIIEPHIDDSLLGTMHVLLKKDIDIYVVSVSSGKPNEIEKRERAIKYLFEGTNVTQFFLRADDKELRCKDVVHIANAIDIIRPDKVYIPAYEGHPLHKDINQAFKIIPLLGARCYEYVVYGRDCLAKRFTNFVNCFLAPLDWLWGGYTPKFDKSIKPYYVYEFTPEESQLKEKVISIYRYLVGDPYNRVMPYKAEIFREVRYESV